MPSSFDPSVALRFAEDGRAHVRAQIAVEAQTRRRADRLPLAFGLRLMGRKSTYLTVRICGASSVNGFLVDLRNMPREVQQIAFDKGMIPYIPADREKDLS
jgi:hypothetical protein